MPGPKQEKPYDIGFNAPPPGAALTNETPQVQENELITDVPPTNQNQKLGPENKKFSEDPAKDLKNNVGDKVGLWAGWNVGLPAGTRRGQITTGTLKTPIDGTPQVPYLGAGDPRGVPPIKQ